MTSVPDEGDCATSATGPGWAGPTGSGASAHPPRVVANAMAELTTASLKRILPPARETDASHGAPLDLGRGGPRECGPKGYHSRIKREASASTIPRTPPGHELRAARIRERYREHGKQGPCRTGRRRNRQQARVEPGSCRTIFTERPWLAQRLKRRAPRSLVSARPLLPGWVKRGLRCGSQLRRIQNAALYDLVLDHLIVPHQRIAHRASHHANVLPKDRVRDLALRDVAPHLQRDVGSDRGVVDRHAVLDVDRRHDRATGGGSLGHAGSSLLEQVAIGLEQRLHLAAVVPPTHRRCKEPPAAVHHVLEGVGEIVLAPLPGRLPQHVRDTVEQRLPVLDVIQPDVGELDTGVLGFSTIVFM